MFAFGSILRVAVAVSLLTLSLAVSAEDGTEGIDACLQAGLTRLPGHVNEWRLEGEGAARSLRFRVVTPENDVHEFSCQPTTGDLTEPKRAGLGQMKYEMLAPRAKVPEVDARRVVKEHYPGRFVDMTFKTTWKGGAMYVYTVITPDNREATIEVDAAVGRIARSKSVARDL
jgi:uncharacterized membrane protein YkoI